MIERKAILLTQQEQMFMDDSNNLSSRLSDFIQAQSFGGTPHLGAGIIQSEAKVSNWQMDISSLKRDNSQLATNNEYELIFMSAIDVGVDRIRNLLRQNPTLATKTIIGGQGVTPLANEFIDEFPEISVVAGRSEGVISQILKDHESQKETQTLYNQRPDFSLENADNEPYMDPLFTFRNNQNFQKSRIKPIETSTGCTQKCEMCPLRNEKITNKPIDVLIKEIENMKLKFGDILLFVDHNLFNNQGSYLEQLFENINKKGIIWTGEGSIYQVINNDKLLKLMAKNCLSFLSGLEDPFNELKGSPVKSNLRENFPQTLQKLRSFKFPVTWSLVFPLDSHTPNTYLKTAAFIKNNNLNTNIHLLVPRPGSDLYNNVQNDKRWLNTSDSRYRDGLHMTFEPKSMNWIDAFAGYIWLKNKITSPSWLRERFENNIKIGGVRYASALLGIEISADMLIARKLKKMYPQISYIIKKYEDIWSRQFQKGL